MTTTYGEYYDKNGNKVVRENCADAIENGNLKVNTSNICFWV